MSKQIEESLGHLFTINPIPGVVSHSQEGTQNLELLPQERRVGNPHQALQLLGPEPERQFLQNIELRKPTDSGQGDPHALMT